MGELQFDNQVVVVTGAANEPLGEAYCLFFGLRHAKVVVNGNKAPKSAVDKVVDKIQKAGGTAIGNYDCVTNGNAIIRTAIEAYGRIDVLINHANIDRDAYLEDMTDMDWNSVIETSITGAYQCTLAAWPYFREQAHGRILGTGALTGLFGNTRQCNYSAATMAQLGFMKTLAKEGQKYNIICNTIVPIYACSATAPLVAPKLLKFLISELVIPLAAILVHPSNRDKTGLVFQAGGGHIAMLRWERSKGALLRPDKSLTPGSILDKWSDVNDFSKPTYPINPDPFTNFLEESQRLPSVAQSSHVDLTGKVAVITGAGAGIGRAYALAFAKSGARVVVNDMVNPDVVVDEIRGQGGKAIASKTSIVFEDKVIDAAIQAFGRIDILVNNAGILRDKAFKNMTDQAWREIMDVHLHGTYKTTKAAYQLMVKQQYGRIINTTSMSGLYGSFGQSNYATAKLAIIGFTLALAREGSRHNVCVSAIAPNAGTNMTRTILPEVVVQALKPEYVAQAVVALCSDRVPAWQTGGLFEVGSGWVGRTRLQRSHGHSFAINAPFTVDDVMVAWDDIANFDGPQADHPENMSEGLHPIILHLKASDMASASRL